MSKVPSSYFVVQSKLKPIMEAIQRAGVPDKFTLAFLDSLGFKSTNDRPIVAVLKSLNFLNQSGVPTQIYRDYKNSSMGAKVLANSIREAYSDVFLADENANNLSIEKLKGIFASLSGKSDSVAQKMAGTFKMLCSLADFSGSSMVQPERETDETDEKPIVITPPLEKPSSGSAQFHYNIQIHLPSTSDVSVYNAIFKSLKEHLM